MIVFTGTLLWRILIDALNAPMMEDQHSSTIKTNCFLVARPATCTAVISKNEPSWLIQSLS